MKFDEGFITVRHPTNVQYTKALKIAFEYSFYDFWEEGKNLILKFAGKPGKLDKELKNCAEALRKTGMRCSVSVRRNMCT